MKNINQYLNQRIEYETFQMIVSDKIKEANIISFQQRKQFLVAISNGDMDEVTRFLHQFIGKIKIKEGKQHQQDFLEHITILIHYIADAAIIGGVSEQLSYLMRNVYLKSLHEFSGSMEARTIFIHCANSFTLQVKQNKYKNSLSVALSDCISYIGLHIHDKILLRDLCQLTNLSTRQLSRRFNKELNCSCLSYIQREKIKQAELFLCCTRNTIVQIANQFAFCSESHFSNTFKRFTGMSPKEYRQQYSFVDDWGIL